MDELDMPREMPGHDTRRLVKVLWRRYWHLSEQVDRHATHIHHLKEQQMTTQDDLDAITAELGTALTNIQAEIAALQAANPALDLTALRAAADALAAVAPAPAPPAEPTA